MTNVLQWFILLLSGIIQMCLQGAFVLSIFNKKFTWRNLLLFALLNALVLQLPRFSQYNAVLNLLVYFAAIILSMVYLLRLKYVHSILATCLVILMSTLVEYSGMAILQLAFQGNFDLQVWMKSLPYLILMRNTANFLWFVAIAAIQYVKMKIVLPQDIRKKKIFGLIVNALVSVIIIIPNTLFFQNTEIQIPESILVFNIISILALLLLSIYNSMKSGELEAKTQEVEFQNLYIQTLSELNDRMRSFKHDFGNNVSVIGGYLALGDIEGLKRYYTQIQNEYRTTNNLLPLNSYVRDNPAVYGLILSKITYSEIHNINLNINIFTAINTGSMKVYDFCRILGILLDNALEAANETSRKYVEFTVKKGPNQNTLVITVSNTFSGTLDLEKMSANGYTTKPNHSGFGLWEVKKLVSKNRNCELKTFINGDMITQHLEISY